MTNNPESPSSGQSLEGQQFQLSDAEARRRVIELAFDYRGDVTITLQSGQTIEGYVFDRSSHPLSPTVKIFPKEESGPLEFRYDEVAGLTFSGEDTAFGKSWEDWLNKMEKVSQKKESF